MISPPAAIQILHLSFELRFVDETFFDAANAFGYCDKKRLVICISKGLRPALMVDTVIHEAIHGIHFAIGADEELNEERLALQFAGPLCLLYRDNQELFAWFHYLLFPPGCDDGAYQ